MTDSLQAGLTTEELIRPAGIVGWQLAASIYEI